MQLTLLFICVCALYIAYYNGFIIIQKLYYNFALSAVSFLTKDKYRRPPCHDNCQYKTQASQDVLETYERSVGQRLSNQSDTVRTIHHRVTHNTSTHDRVTEDVPKFRGERGAVTLMQSQPCLCLCRCFFVHTTRSLPFRMTNLQPSHISFREDLTLYSLCGCIRGCSKTTQRARYKN